MKVEITLDGTLKSMRDKSLNRYRNQQFNNRAIKEEQELWYEKILAGGYQHKIKKLFQYCLDNKKRMAVRATVYRKIPIRDYKNLVGGFDHSILDGWVNAELIKDDSTKYIYYVIDQIQSKELDRVEIVLYPY